MPLFSQDHECISNPFLFQYCSSFRTIPDKVDMPSDMLGGAPGPSTLVAFTPAVNSNGNVETILHAQSSAVSKKERDMKKIIKRPSSETSEDGQRDKKKSKIDRVGIGGANNLNSTSLREKVKKRKRRKRRKRMSTPPPDVTQNLERERSRSRSPPVSSSQVNNHTASYTKSGPISLLNCKKDSEDEAPTFSVCELNSCLLLL